MGFVHDLQDFSPHSLSSCGLRIPVCKKAQRSFDYVRRHGLLRPRVFRGGNPDPSPRLPRPRRRTLYQFLQREHVRGLAGLHADRGLSPDLLEERYPAPQLPDPVRGSADKRVRNRNDGEVALGGEIHQKQRGQRRLPRPTWIRPLLRNPRRGQQFLRPLRFATGPEVNRRGIHEGPGLLLHRCDRQGGYRLPQGDTQGKTLFSLPSLHRCPLAPSCTGRRN